jgi:hypothetical protein
MSQPFEPLVLSVGAEFARVKSALTDHRQFRRRPPRQQLATFLGNDNVLLVDQDFDLRPVRAGGGEGYARLYGEDHARLENGFIVRMDRGLQLLFVIGFE